MWINSEVIIIKQVIKKYEEIECVYNTLEELNEDYNDMIKNGYELINNYKGMTGKLMDLPQKRKAYYYAKYIKKEEKKEIFI